MKLRVEDQEVLARVDPANARAYLQSHGWEREVVARRRGSEVWSLQDEDARTRGTVLLPLEPAWRDFTLRVAELLQTLAEVEDRSELSILQDLLAANADLVRVTVEPSGGSPGSIVIEDGIQLVTHSRNLVVAAACSVVQPRTQHPGRRPGRVNDYLEKVRLGQTEAGSYAITLLSPVAVPAPDSAARSVPAGEEPFSRQAVRMLATALQAARDAADQALMTGELRFFIDSVEEGVSANLCDALASMRGQGRGSVKVGLSFSAAFPAPAGLPTDVTFPADTMPVLVRATELLRSTGSQPDVVVTGLVRRLERPALGGPGGRISIAALIDDKVRPVAVELDDEGDYRRAIVAHQEGFEVTVEGDLERQGRGFVLTAPRGFVVLSE